MYYVHSTWRLVGGAASVSPLNMEAGRGRCICVHSTWRLVGGAVSVSSLNMEAGRGRCICVSTQHGGW